MSRKKILIHSLVFSPDGVSTAYLYNDIALRFQKEGFEVVVLTTTPHYNLLESELEKQPLLPRLFGLYYISNFRGIKVVHIPQKKFKSSLLRIIGFIHWHVLAFFLGLREKSVKVIISPSPPLTIGFLNWLISRFNGAKVIYNVQEIYPDFLINQGKLKSGIMVSLLKSLERFIYRKSDSVTTIDPVFYNTIVDRFDKSDKLKIIPNFVDLELFKPESGSVKTLDENIFPYKPETLKFMYAGNIGHAQDWVPLIQLAKALINHNVEFWVIGEGVMKKFLDEQISALRLKNIHVVPYQHRDLMPSLIAYADLHFIFMSPKMEGQGFPSKVYSIMACAKPLLVISGKSTPICNFLDPVNCSFLIMDKQVNSQHSHILSIIENLLLNKSILKTMGRRGYQYILETHSKDIVTKQYVELVNQLIEP